MKETYKKYFGEFILILAAASYSFEWYFIRELSVNYNSMEITFAKVFFSVLMIFFFFIFYNKNFFNFKTILKKDWFLLILS